MKVRDICIELPTIRVDRSLHDAARLLTGKDVEALVVLDKKRPVGIVGSYEILEKLLEGARLEDIRAKSVMNSTLLKVGADQTIEEAAQILLAHKHWMAIVTEKGEYKGVVTAGGLIKVLMK